MRPLPFVYMKSIAFLLILPKPLCLLSVRMNITNLSHTGYGASKPEANEKLGGLVLGKSKSELSVLEFHFPAMPPCGYKTVITGSVIEKKVQRNGSE